MKKRLFPAMLLAATLGVVGCADKDLDGIANSTEDSGKYAYINAAISFPSSGFTRSKTDNYPDVGNGETNSNGDGTQTTPDYENAYDYESDVRSMILVIANKNDEYLTHTVVPSIAPKGTTGNTNNPTYLVNSKIPYDVLEKAYFEGTEGGNDKGILEKTKETDGSIKVNLYAYCNYTSDILDKFDKYAASVAADEEKDLKKWIDWAGTVEEAPAAAGKTKPTITNTIWAKRSFLMTNYDNYQTNKFPNDIEGWDAYANQSNALDLTMNNSPLKVERVAARFDFKDGSKKQKVVDGIIVPDENGEPNNKNTYQLWTAITTTSSSGTTTPSEGEPSTQAEEEEGEGGTTTTTTTKIKNYFSVKLTRMALVNMSKNYYYLRRVSDDGMPKATDNQDAITNGWKVGGYEYYQETTDGTTGKVTRNYNYVVDTDAELKQKPGTEGGITPGEEAGKHFNFCLYGATKDANGKSPYNKEAWYADNITDVLEGTEVDQWNNEHNYHIWRYVTENTIPQSEDKEHPESQQKTIQSTGIVFKGAIVAGEDLLNPKEDEDTGISEKVKNALTEAAKPKGERDEANLPILYSFDNVLYAGMEELIENAYKEGENSPFYQAVDNILTKHWKYSSATKSYTFSEEPINVEADLDANATEDDKRDAHKDDLTVTRCYYILHQDEDEYKEEYEGYSLDFVLSDDATETEKKEVKEHIEKPFCKLVPQQNITVYEATDEGEPGDGVGAGLGYYCYYFYWNRHNDNGNSGKMGPMEFAVVRNNVYKLAVTSISQLGHPRDTSHDPDPVDPEDPDEDPTRYIKVDVQVLPWVVRENNITF